MSVNPGRPQAWAGTDEFIKTTLFPQVSYPDPGSGPGGRGQAQCQRLFAGQPALCWSRAARAGGDLAWSPDDEGAAIPFWAWPGTGHR